jgi:hypothetical protein
MLQSRNVHNMCLSKIVIIIIVIVIDIIIIVTGVCIDFYAVKAGVNKPILN